MDSKEETKFDEEQKIYKDEFLKRVTEAEGYHLNWKRVSKGRTNQSMTGSIKGTVYKVGTYTGPSDFTDGIQSGELNIPTSGTITQAWSTKHGGIDFGNSLGTPVCAAAQGTVLQTTVITTAQDYDGSRGGSYGQYIVIDHGGGVTTLYAHLSEFKVSAGDIVSKGQVIGLMGTSGHSTGSHLHFELKVNNVRTDPTGYFGG